MGIGKDGYGSKIVDVEVSEEHPHHFRLLSDTLFGYMWPKYVKAGERAEFRVHAVEEYELELWRYGVEKEFIRRLGTFDEHGPRATMQITPDGDYTQSGVHWNKHGYHSKAHKQQVEAPEQSGLYFLHARTKSGDFFAFPWIVAPSRPPGMHITVLEAAAITFMRTVFPIHQPLIPVWNSRDTPKKNIARMILRASLRFRWTGPTHTITSMNRNT